jgi:hypothetical protein
MKDRGSDTPQYCHTSCSPLGDTKTPRQLLFRKVISTQKEQRSLTRNLNDIGATVSAERVEFAGLLSNTPLKSESPHSNTMMDDIYEELNLISADSRAFSEKLKDLQCVVLS